MDKDTTASSFDALIDAIAEEVAERMAKKLQKKHEHDPTGVRWMSMKDVAEKTGIDYTTIVKATNTGELPCYTPLGRKRLDPAEVDEWVRKYHNATTSPTQTGIIPAKDLGDFYSEMHDGP